MSDDIRDDSGRPVAPPQSTYERPAGPWDANNTEPLHRACAWCPDFVPTPNTTHVMCPTCYQKMMKEIDGL